MAQFIVTYDRVIEEVIEADCALHAVAKSGFNRHYCYRDSLFIEDGTGDVYRLEELEDGSGVTEPEES